MNSVSKNKKNESLSLLLSPKDYFVDMVEDGLHHRKIKSDHLVKQYLVDLLLFYLSAENLFEKEKLDESGKKRPQTLAELYLIAINSDVVARIDLLKKLADKALYVSGFFGDSFARKIIDVDYYVSMGENAYGELSYAIEKQDPRRKVYSIFSKNFSEYVDLLSYISHKSMISNNQSLLRLYDNYLKTGSEVAKEKLLEMGIVTLPNLSLKKGITQN
ncbi:MAG: hypothetical protein L6Q37_00960 [Bdellovibrionaceae bacterium]|nr:hypothetical protein [Pseudobdellovibrionaceae bacterium]NUM58373.1 hypothetical protein [Pseudobdellovibrionaceae bacterium]